MSLLVLSTIRKRLQAYDAKINWVVFCLVFGFTIGNSYRLAGEYFAFD